MGEEDLDQKEEYYEPIEDNLSVIFAKSLDPNIIFNKKDAIIVLDKVTAKPVATLDIDHWELSKK